MPSITSGFLRAPSKCWYPSGRCSASWPQWSSCGMLSWMKSKHADAKNTSKKKLLFLSILPPLVRRVSGAHVQPVETGQPGSNANPEGDTTMRFMLLLPAPAQALEDCAIPPVEIVTAMRKFSQDMVKA